jgi:hypothetical protein
LGDEAAVERFTLASLRSSGAVVTASGADVATVDLREASPPLRDLLDSSDEIAITFRGGPYRGVEYLTRTHPIVEHLARWVLEAALDPSAEAGPARRGSVVRTEAVDLRTTLLLLRLRFHLVVQRRDGEETPLLAEDQLLVGYRGAPERPEWVLPEQLESLLAATPSANTAPEIAARQLQRVIEGLPALRSKLTALAVQRGEELLAAHRRVRQAAHQSVRALRVEPHLPADVLGAFVYLPTAGGVA